MNMNRSPRKPELLAPAGDMEKLKMAVLYGADAVYLAGTSFGMRSFAGNFTPEELPQAVSYAHSHGVKVHATVNTMARNDEVERLPAHLELLDACGVDALIVADLGAFRLAEKYAPHCQRHISTQVSVANFASAEAWYALGAKRVVLARELSMDEIRQIRRRVPARALPSPPARERGLKPAVEAPDLGALAVAPRVGAWIETSANTNAMINRLRRSPRGSVD